MAEQRVRVPISRVNPNKVLPTFANDMTVNHSADTFYLTFSIIEPPALYKKSELDKVKSVDAVAVSKLVITAEFANAIAIALTENIAKSKRQKEDTNDS